MMSTDGTTSPVGIRHLPSVCEDLWFFGTLDIIHEINESGAPIVGIMGVRKELPQFLLTSHEQVVVPYNDIEGCPNLVYLYDKETVGDIHVYDLPHEEGMKSNDPRFQRVVCAVDRETNVVFIMLNRMNDYFIDHVIDDIMKDYGIKKGGRNMIIHTTHSSDCISIFGKFIKRLGYIFKEDDTGYKNKLLTLHFDFRELSIPK